MALYKPTEFADLCGITLANLSTYKGRNKVVCSSNMYDDSNEVNAAFLAKQLAKKGRNDDVKPVNTAEKPTIVVQNDAVLDEKRKRSSTKTDDTGEGGSIHQLDKQKKKLDIEKTAEEIELLRKKNEKMDGDLVPTELAKALIKLHFTSATNQFKNSIENMLTSWTKKKDFSREEVADIRHQLTENMNDAIKQSVKESQKGLLQIVNDYKVKRGIGERT